MERANECEKEKKRLTMDAMCKRINPYSWKKTPTRGVLEGEGVWYSNPLPHGISHHHVFGIWDMREMLRAQVANSTHCGAPTHQPLVFSSRGGGVVRERWKNTWGESASSGKILIRAMQNLICSSVFHHLFRPWWVRLLKSPHLHPLPHHIP